MESTPDYLDASLRLPVKKGMKPWVVVVFAALAVAGALYGYRYVAIAKWEREWTWRTSHCTQEKIEAEHREILAMGTQPGQTYTFPEDWCLVQMDLQIQAKPAIAKVLPDF